MAESIVPPGMINRAAYEELRAADLSEDQAKAVAAHLPDWSRFATRRDLDLRFAELRGEMAELRGELRGELREMQASLIRWMVGIFLAFTTLLGALLTWANLFA